MPPPLWTTNLTYDELVRALDSSREGLARAFLEAEPDATYYGRLTAARCRLE
ncbi:MAG: hypothetical protein HY319_30820 [Armatimonadetes bacterium]|nr:hypothetical protein [Armatimonadota bacterium]